MKKEACKNAAVPCSQRQLKIEDFQYPLLNKKIALYPLSERDSSKLLIYKNNETKESLFKNITDYLPCDSFLVMNNTRVVHARIVFYKTEGARIEIFCLQAENPSEITQAFASRGEVEFRCLIGNNKKWKDGTLSLSFPFGDKEETLTVERLSREEDSFIVRFTYPPQISFSEVLEAVGKVPLPPYIDRDAEEGDKERYQTVFAKHDGSVAAPTAGLHFTPELLQQIDNKGIQREYVTLHVGAGTFKPVKAGEIGQHQMHREYISVNIDFLERLYCAVEQNRTIVPVGTTSMRTLESLYWLGVLLIDGHSFNNGFVLKQWLPYESYGQRLPYTATEAIEALLKYAKEREQETIHAYSSLMIAPGYKFAFCKGIITNFHQPQSTLLLLVSALIGDKWKELYDYALENDFRFLSYGDSCLFLL